MFLRLLIEVDLLLYRTKRESRSNSSMSRRHSLDQNPALVKLPSPRKVALALGPVVLVLVDRLKQVGDCRWAMLSCSQEPQSLLAMERILLG